MPGVRDDAAVEVVADGEAIKLDVDDTPLCRLCLSRARSLVPGEPACERLCPRLLFG
jgi:hypothetical protein